MGKFV